MTYSYTIIHHGILFVVRTRSSRRYLVVDVATRTVIMRTDNVSTAGKIADRNNVDRLTIIFDTHAREVL